MAMLKIFSPYGWDWDCPVATIVKAASSGLRSQDRRDFIKRASGSESIFLPFLDNLKRAGDEELVHMIAVGADEKWGGNRNGDGFPEKDCIACHDTFQKFAKPFRNHRNKLASGHPYYGAVKLSAYNPVMARIELLVAYNKEKSAAERNGGFVADKELEALEKKGKIAVSMACRINHDLCSYCGNKAHTRDEYCTCDKCAAGGCRDNLAKVVKVGRDLHHLRVFNPGPGFFDISHVWRPAERTAYGAPADWLTKAAADNGFTGVDGASLAEQLSAPLTLQIYQEALLPGQWLPYVAEQVKLAYALDLLDRRRELLPPVKRAFDARLQAELHLAPLDLDTSKPEKLASGLAALAEEKIILPLREFARLTKRASLTEDAGALLAGVYGRLIADGSLEQRIVHNRYVVGEKRAAVQQQRAARQLRSALSLQKDAVQQRCALSSVRQYDEPKSTFKGTKQASASVLAEELARDYAVYQLSALRKIAAFDLEFPLTARLAALQNQVA